MVYKFTISDRDGFLSPVSKRHTPKHYRTI